MGKIHSQSWTWTFESPPERIWPLLADTARFNEAAGLPRTEIEERPRPDGSVLYLGRARKGPFQLEWEEDPVNWVAGRWFRHCRHFSRGPVGLLCATFRLEQEGAGSRASYLLEASARNWMGEIILRASFFTAAGRDFGRLAREADRYARGQAELPFDYRPPDAPEGAGQRLEEAIARIEESGHGAGLAARLGRFVTTAQEVDLTRIRPLALARAWGVGERQTIELCLEATRQGLLSLRWDLLCPRCRVAKAMVGSLDELPRGAHCDTCNIDYDRDFSRNVELSFQPAPAIRPVVGGEYCLFGPESTPHILVHLTLEPGEASEEALTLEPGRYRLRTLEPGPELELDWAGEGEGGEVGFPAVIAEPEAMRAGDAAAPGLVRLENRSQRRLTLIVEECRWVRDALTADRVTALQAFRDLFSAQVLRPGDEVAIAQVTLLFTDLAGSTALYDRIGDAEAYRLVREHFAFLARVVREQEGAVVKTIGDAVMAAFSDPAAALRAALAMQGEIERFNRENRDSPLQIKVGLHEGPCIAVTLNERLDYFGSTVNLAARLQGQSRAGDIVISESLAGDPAVAPLIAELRQAREKVRLKGFESEVSLRRITP